MIEKSKDYSKAEKMYNISAGQTSLFQVQDENKKSHDFLRRATVDLSVSLLRVEVF